jgi:N6-adenosine-specific RNA methylase IME4
MENKFYIEGLTKRSLYTLNDIQRKESELYDTAEKLAELKRLELYDQNLTEKYYILQNQIETITDNFLNYNSVKN